MKKVGIGFMVNKKLANLALSSLALYTAFKGYKIYSRPSKRKDLKGKTAVITGASKGIGKAIAIELAKEGCNLVLAARGREKLEELVTELQKNFNIEALAVPTDVSSELETVNLIEKTLEKFGHIDILINNAGTSTYEFFHKESLEHLRKIMEINYWGILNCTHAALPSMIKRGKGKIVNITSFAGKKGLPAMANYCASKHAVHGFSEGLRIELAKYGIDVILVCPTSTKTEIVANSMNNSAFKLDPENYFGMSAERVARETVNAMLDNKREHVIGLGEKAAVKINALAPSLVDTVIKNGYRFVFKD